MPVTLKVLEGPDAGATVRLNNGETVVGTGSRASLRLTTPTASVEHFVVTQVDDNYTIENLSARGTQLNDAKIAGKVRLRLRDKIRVSEDTVIRVETEGGDSLITQYRSLVTWLIVFIIVIGVILLIFDPFSDPPASADWERTQPALTKYVEGNKKYPPELKRAWSAAWRKDKAGRSVNDFREVSKEWLAVFVALQKYEKIDMATTKKKDDDAEKPSPLETLLRNPRPDTWIDDHWDKSDQIGQILLEFAERRYRRAMQRSEQKQGLLD
jgi:hypothetical protein